MGEYERAAKARVLVNFAQANIFDWEIGEGGYDLVYDSGCFHHLPPHRRVSYLSLLDRALAERGFFGLVCFAWGGGAGSEASDESYYRDGRLGGLLTPTAICGPSSSL